MQVHRLRRRLPGRLLPRGPEHAGDRPRRVHRLHRCAWPNARSRRSSPRTTCPRRRRNSSALNAELQGLEAASSSASPRPPDADDWKDVKEKKHLDREVTLSGHRRFNDDPIALQSEQHVAAPRSPPVPGRWMEESRRRHRFRAGRSGRPVATTCASRRSSSKSCPIPVFFKGRDGHYSRREPRLGGVLRREARRHHGRATDRTSTANAPAVAERHQRDGRGSSGQAPATSPTRSGLPLRDGPRAPHHLLQGHVHRPDGEVAGLIGTIVDITERKHAEQREAIEHAGGSGYLGSRRIAARGDPRNHAGDVRAARLGVRGALVAWTRRTTACTASRRWSEDDDRIRAFLEASAPRDASCPGRRELIRRVLTTGDSVWVADVTEKPDFDARRPRPPRRACGAPSRFRCAWATSVLGAIEFFSREPRHPDKWLLLTTVSIGNLIGQLMARRQAEASMREAFLALEAKDARAHALQRGAAAVRLRGLARPAGAAAHDLELHAAARRGATATSSTATRRSSWPSSSTAPRA